jgi:hypothetical protein
MPGTPGTHPGWACGRAHVSKSLIAQVGSGHKLTTPSLVAAVSAALNVDLTDLTGQLYRGNNARRDRIHTAIPQIRQALVYRERSPDSECSASAPGLAGRGDRPGRPAADVSQLGGTRRSPALLLELTVHAHQSRDAQRARLPVPGRHAHRG